MIIGITIVALAAFLILQIVGAAIGYGKTSEICFVLTFISLILAIGMTIFGFFHGFINYPKTEGVHQGVITAVDLEGVHFRRYEVYLKSSGYTNQSDETIYKIYDYETELAEQLQSAIGKTVKLYYGHDGGYIGWKSCGTYHIKRVEILEEE